MSAIPQTSDQLRGGVDPNPSAEPDRAESIWGKAVYKFRRDRAGMVGLGVVFAYLVMALGVWLGVWGMEWSDVEGPKWAPMSAEHWFGTNIIGQDIFQRAVYSTKTAFEIGLIVAVLSTIIGALFGALAGFFSGTWIDEIILWMKGVLDSIPFYLFVAAVAFALEGNAWSMHVAMVSVFWTTTGRLVRGEVIKLRNFEFVEASRAIGVPQTTIIFRHIVPNTFHILLVQATIVFVAAIKSEVILSFLGLGVQDGVSWGLMISESTLEVLAGYFNNFVWASVFLFGLVMAFNMFSDALQDALDPKKVAQP
ncbi:ABC transporter permease [Lentisalinibacter salinarum]|uniref:ABC transporter permease n=1 Tax=Lentisalinibacter salinarum TaxID=2992239 RepID=UPI00386EE237